MPQHDLPHRHRAGKQQLIGAGAAFLCKGAHGEHRDIQKQHKRGAVKRVIAKIRQAVAQIQGNKIDGRCRQHKGGEHVADHAMKAAADFAFENGGHSVFSSPSSDGVSDSFSVSARNTSSSVLFSAASASTVHPACERARDTSRGGQKHRHFLR